MTMQTVKAAHAGLQQPPVATGKPLLRGVSHQIAFFVALAATAVLVRHCETKAGAQATFVFGASLCLLLGTSALYHRIHWAPAARQRMRRMDHAAIFVLTAGGYTPLFALVASPTGANNYLALYAIWAAGCFGVVKSIAWPSAPKWLTALVSVIIGWTGIGPTVARLPVVGSMCIALIFASGVTFSLGAVVYALKRPNPWPKVFGYHEIFHLFVIAASALLFAHVALVVRAAGA